MNDLTAAVLRGAGLLDRVRPGWEHTVDWRHLDMRSCHRCILGWVFGDGRRHLRVGRMSGYWFGLYDLDIPWSQAPEYGFALLVDSEDEWALLAREWEILLKWRIIASNYSDTVRKAPVPARG